MSYTMNYKIKAILFKLLSQLKKLGWRLDKNFEITLQGEGVVSLYKSIYVDGMLRNEPIRDNFETIIYIKMETSDNINYYPSFIINTEFYFAGGDIKDVNHSTDLDVKFGENDINNDGKINQAANGINNSVKDYIQVEFTNYIDANGLDITDYRSSGRELNGDESLQN